MNVHLFNEIHPRYMLYRGKALSRDVCNEEAPVVSNFFDSAARLSSFSFALAVSVELFDLNNILNDLERRFRSPRL